MEQIREREERKEMRKMKQGIDKVRRGKEENEKEDAGEKKIKGGK